MLKPTPRVNQAGVQGERELHLRSLFDTEEAPLLRYAFALVGRRAVAEEIVQEVFGRWPRLILATGVFQSWDLFLRSGYL